jgi:hypothetical protein
MVKRLAWFLVGVALSVALVVVGVRLGDFAEAVSHGGLI